MTNVFLKVLNMSISAGYVVLAVLLLRLVLKKAPKWIAVALWGIVAVRLICPFSFESVLSLIPSAEVVSPDIMLDRNPQINSGIPIVNQVINPVISESFAPDPMTGANPLQLWIPTLAAIWILGMVAMLVYTVVSYARVKRRIGTAVRLRDNIYQSESVVSPFVLGIFTPKIYLSFNMNEQNTSHVIAHEQAHIRRRDHLWKPLGFLLLTLHWFNPLMWLGYVLLCRDIELACDEKVIKKLDDGQRADYSEALLACSVNRRMLAACPLAFGEVGVKKRIKSALNYKKPAFWIIIGAIVISVVVAVCFLTNPKSDNENKGETDPNKLNKEQSSLIEKYPEYFGLDASKGLDVYVSQMAKNTYSFILSPHSSLPLGMFKLMDMPAVGAESMRQILSTYAIDYDSDVYIIPWQNPLSSYIGEYWIAIEGEDAEAKQAAYINKVREILFGMDTPLGWHDLSSTDGHPALIYANPTMSYVIHPSQVPTPIIKGDKLYDMFSGAFLGHVKEVSLNESEFLNQFKPLDENDKYKVKEMLLNTATAYQITPTNMIVGVGLYYLLIQKDGSTLMVYGHYNPFSSLLIPPREVRWIFDLGKE